VNLVVARNFPEGYQLAMDLSFSGVVDGEACTPDSQGYRHSFPCTGKQACYLVHLTKEELLALPASQLKDNQENGHHHLDTPNQVELHLVAIEINKQ